MFEKIILIKIYSENTIKESRSNIEVIFLQNVLFFQFLIENI